MRSNTRAPKSSASTPRAGVPRKPAPRLVADANVGDTKGRILDATFRCLATRGYAALRVRDIAEEAGVNVALINYHFGSKDQLVLDVLDAANEKLLDRQRQMYRGKVGFAAKWAEARRFYESDLASGFVRVQAELMAAAYANPWLKEHVTPRVAAWGNPIHETVREIFEEMAAQGVALPQAITPEVVTNWVCNFWIGMEVGDLLGGWSPPERANAKALTAVQELLDSLDARAAKRLPARRTRR
ncbi:MAG: TetR/AcrR family transcriptional regulator [Rubrivivax sp.]|nr:TetR/AcrR family transcriptional regulator [Rubrivivax sp.]